MCYFLQITHTLSSVRAELDGLGDKALGKSTNLSNPLKYKYFFNELLDFINQHSFKDSNGIREIWFKQGTDQSHNKLAY